MQILGKTETNCDIILRSEIVTVPGLISEPYPHPLQDHGNIDIAIAEKSDLRIIMHNAFNPQETIPLHDAMLIPGTYTISFATDQMTSGLWMMEIHLGQHRNTIPLLIQR